MGRVRRVNTQAGHWGRSQRTMMSPGWVGGWGKATPREWFPGWPTPYGLRERPVATGETCTWLGSEGFTWLWPWGHRDVVLPPLQVAAGIQSSPRHFLKQRNAWPGSLWAGIAPMSGVPQLHPWAGALTAASNKAIAPRGTSPPLCSHQHLVADHARAGTTLLQLPRESQQGSTPPSDSILAPLGMAQQGGIPGHPLCPGRLTPWALPWAYFPFQSVFSDAA